MKNEKLLVMMCILFIINLAVIIISLLNTVNAMTILYRMAIFCNLAIFAPSINLIYRELKNKKIIIRHFYTFIQKEMR